MDSDSSGTNTPVGGSNGMGKDVTSTKGRVRRITPSQFLKSSRDDMVLYPGHLHPSFTELTSRSCIMLMRIQNSDVSLLSYNWNRLYCDGVFSQVLRCISWNNIRMQYLERQVQLIQSLRPVDYRSELNISSQSYGISYSSSYGGVGGFGGSAMQHFGKRFNPKFLAGDDAETDHYRKIYSMDADILQRHAGNFNYILNLSTIQ
jgi:hypothetical protein